MPRLPRQLRILSLSLPTDAPPHVFDLASDICRDSRTEGIKRAARMMQETDNAPLWEGIDLPRLVISETPTARLISLIEAVKLLI